MDSDYSPSWEGSQSPTTPKDGVQELAEMVFSRDPSKKRRLSLVMTELSTESPEKKKCLEELREILDPDGKDIEVSESAFLEGCVILQERRQEISVLSPCVSPMKNASKVLNFRSSFSSPLKRLSSGYTLSDSDISMSSSPSPDLHVELSRLREENRSIQVHSERVETSNTDLLARLSNSEDKIAELEIQCKDLKQLVATYEKKATLRHSVNFCEVDFAAKESECDQLRQCIERMEEELVRRKAKEVELAIKLEKKMTDYESLMIDKEDLENHAASLHKSRQDDEKILEQMRSRIATVEQQLHELTLAYEIVLEENVVLKKETKSLEGYKRSSKYYSQLNDELAAAVEHLQRSLPALKSSDTSDDEKHNAQPMSLKDELGGSLSPLNTSSDMELSAVMSTSAVEADHLVTPQSVPGTDETQLVSPLATPSIGKDPENEDLHEEQIENRQLSCLDNLTIEFGARNERAILQHQGAICNAGWHVNPFSAVVAFLMYGYLLVWFVILLLRPYLDYRTLLSSRPWFLSVGEGDLAPPPV